MSMMDYDALGALTGPPVLSLNDASSSRARVLAMRCKVQKALYCMDGALGKLPGVPAKLDEYAQQIRDRYSIVDTTIRSILIAGRPVDWLSQEHDLTIALQEIGIAAGIVVKTVPHVAETLATIASTPSMAIPGIGGLGAPPAVGSLNEFLKVRRQVLGYAPTNNTPEANLKYLESIYASWDADAQAQYAQPMQDARRQVAGDPEQLAETQRMQTRGKAIDTNQARARAGQAQCESRNPIPGAGFPWSWNGTDCENLGPTGASFYQPLVDSLKKYAKVAAVVVAGLAAVKYGPSLYRRARRAPVKANRGRRRRRYAIR